MEKMMLEVLSKLGRKLTLDKLYKTYWVHESQAGPYD